MAGYESDPYTCSTCWGIINVDGAQMVPEDGTLCACEDNPHRLPWPTSEQFDQASTLGTEYALNEFAGGSASAQEAPLSGEWADGLTDRDVALNVGWAPDENADLATMDNYAEGRTELADAWEQAYFAQWNVNYERMAS